MGIGADCQQALKSKGTLIQRSGYSQHESRDIPAWTEPKSDLLIARKIPANPSKVWRPLSSFLFLRRVSPDREGGIIAALPSFNNLIAVGPGDPVGNPLLQPRIKINNLTAVLAGSLI